MHEKDIGRIARPEELPVDQIVDSRPDGNMTVYTQRMAQGQPYHFLHKGVEPAVAVKRADGSIRLFRTFEPTRNPFLKLVHLVQAPIITTPPIRRVPQE